MTRQEQIQKAVIHYLAQRPDFNGVSTRDIEICIWAAKWADENPATTILVERFDVPFIKRNIATLEQVVKLYEDALTYLYDNAETYFYQSNTSPMPSMEEVVEKALTEGRAILEENRC